VGKGKRRKKFSTLPSPMSTRCQYVERERGKGREKKGNLSTQADQYHSAVVALLFFLFFICYSTKLDFNHSQLCAKSTTTNCNNNNNNNNNDDTAFLYSPVIVYRM